MSFSNAGSTEGGGSLLGTDLVTAQILADGSMALSVPYFYLVLIYPRQNVLLELLMLTQEPLNQFAMRAVIVQINRY